MTQTRGGRGTGRWLPEIRPRRPRREEAAGLRPARPRAQGASWATPGAAGGRAHGGPRRRTGSAGTKPQGRRLSEGRGDPAPTDPVGARAERGAARANGGYAGRGPGTQKRPRGRPGEPVGGCGAEGRRPVGAWGLPGPRGGSRGRPRGAPEARAARPGPARRSKPARSDVSPAPRPLWETASTSR